MSYYYRSDGQDPQDEGQSKQHRHPYSKGLPVTNNRGLMHMFHPLYVNKSSEVVSSSSKSGVNDAYDEDNDMYNNVGGTYGDVDLDEGLENDRVVDHQLIHNTDQFIGKDKFYSIADRGINEEERDNGDDDDDDGVDRDGDNDDNDDEEEGADLNEDVLYDTSKRNGEPVSDEESSDTEIEQQVNDYHNEDQLETCPLNGARAAPAVIIVTRDLPVKVTRLQSGEVPLPGSFVTRDNNWQLQWVGRHELWGQLRAVLGRSMSNNTYNNNNNNSIQNDQPCQMKKSSDEENTFDRVLWCGQVRFTNVFPEPTFAEREVIEETLMEHGAQPVFIENKVRAKYDKFCSTVLVPLMHFTPPQFAHMSSLNVTEEEAEEDEYAAFLTHGDAVDATGPTTCTCEVDVDDLWSGFQAVILALSSSIVRSSPHPETKVWVHSMHLALLPATIKAKLPNTFISIFIHSPFPASEVFRSLPQRAAMLRSLLACDMIGVHTYDYARHIVSSARRVLNINFRSLSSGAIVLSYAGHKTYLHVAPAAIDVDFYQQVFENTEAIEELITQWKVRWGGKKTILSFSDFESLEGSPMRLLAYKRLQLIRKDVLFVDVVGGPLAEIVVAVHQHAKENREHWAATSLWQIQQEMLYLVLGLYRASHCTNDDDPSSSSPLQYYPSLYPSFVPQTLSSSFLQSISLIIALIHNHGPDMYCPLVRAKIPFKSLLALCASVSVGLFVPLWHGLALAPYHFAASQMLDDPGVIILSSQLGCSTTLPNAIVTHPSHVGQILSHIVYALDLSPAKRLSTARETWRYVMSRSLRSWCLACITNPHKREAPSQIIATGFPNIRLVQVRADLSKVNSMSVYHEFKRSSHKLILVDFDGTLVPHMDKLSSSDNAPISNLPAYKHVQNIISSLCTLPNTYVFIMSSRKRSILERLFNNDVGLVAESGVAVRWPQALTDRRRKVSGNIDKKGWEWLCNVHLCSADCDVTGCWRRAALSLMKDYAEQTDGAWVHGKECSLEWHFSAADSQFALWQATELSKALVHLVKGKSLRVVTYEQQGILSVAPAGVNKGSVAAFLSNAILGLGCCHVCKESHQLEPLYYDRTLVHTEDHNAAQRNWSWPSVPYNSVPLALGNQFNSQRNHGTLTSEDPLGIALACARPTHLPFESYRPFLLCMGDARADEFMYHAIDSICREGSKIKHTHVHYNSNTSLGAVGGVSGGVGGGVYSSTPHSQQFAGNRKKHPTIIKSLYEADYNRAVNQTQSGAAALNMERALREIRNNKHRQVLMRSATTTDDITQPPPAPVSLPSLAVVPPVDDSTEDGYLCPRATAYCTVTVGLKPTKAHCYIDDEDAAGAFLSTLSGMNRSKPTHADVLGASSAKYEALVLPSIPAIPSVPSVDSFVAPAAPPLLLRPSSSYESMNGLAPLPDPNELLAPLPTNLAKPLKRSVNSIQDLNSLFDLQS